MPPVRKADHVTAVVAADIHLSHAPPAVRSHEPDWYATQAGYLTQVARVLQGQPYGTPLIISGDIFDRWNAPAELINLALEHLPPCYAVPGNHDLSHHSYEDIKKSAFYTLVQAGKVSLLPPGKSLVADRGPTPVRMWGFPYGYEPRPLREPFPLYQDIAVCHCFVWTDRTGFPGAPESGRLGAFRKKVTGYDVVVVGDNHQPFTYSKDPPYVINCGGLMRRTSRERDHEPRVWLVRADNRIEPVFLDTASDVFTETADCEEVSISGKPLAEFMQELREGHECAVSFEVAVGQYLRQENVDAEVSRLVLSWLDDSKET